MIKNVIFDFGKVLVHFDPEYMAGKYAADADDAELLASVVFDRLYWDKLDAGTISDQEVVKCSMERLPKRLHAVASEIYYNWIYNIPEIEGMDKLLCEIKEKYNLRLFLLSNISVYFAEHAEEIPILRHFERCFFSAVLGKTKPNADIFEYLCESCGIRPEETLFIDDSEKNIQGAHAVGIKGYLFDGDAERLGKYLDGILRN